MRPFAFLSAFAALVAALLLLTPTTQGDDKKTYPSMGTIERKDPRFDKLIPKDAILEKLADGFDWSEGPIWIKDGGYLLCSDIPKNQIIKWQEGKGKSVYKEKIGYLGDRTDLKEPGTNGLTVDSEGRLVMCQHGERRVARLEKDGKTVTVLADKFEGKRFNSPNDLVYHSNGDLYFTDPPYGLMKKDTKPGEEEFPGRELDFCGVYRLGKDGKLTLLIKELSKPNGIAFSPDEKTLYIANSDPYKPIWMAYQVKADGTLGNGKTFYDATDWLKDNNKLKGLPDGMKVDKDGNVFATGPGGLHVFTKDGDYLGTIATGVATANCNWGDDGSTLYICADKALTRIKTSTKGKGF
jgi:gluconolactonase